MSLFIIKFLIWLTPFSFLVVKGDDVLGCNGFVKSDVEINFSKVEIKLFTKQGSLKDHTECAPNNGYYFLPLYDKGEYVLKVSPPNGWAFEPSEVPLTVDGESDPCSQGKDINFIFKGFAIEGKVLTEGHNVGPKGVAVRLSKEGQVIQETITREEGGFLFSPVHPGSYVVTTSHPKWKLGQSTASVKVINRNGEASGLTVAGYDVTGSVFSDGQPIAGVRFVLFTKIPLPLKTSGCKSPSRLDGFSEEGSAVCEVVSGESGAFVFPQLPPGAYSLVPHYSATATKFHVHPAVLRFALAHDSLRLDTPFQVKGFTVSGKVFWSPGGKPLSGAVIKLNGKTVAKTGPDGIYHLENMKAGTYNLLVEASGVEFDPTEVRVSATTLPDLHPSRYRVSGRLSPGVGGAKVTASGGQTPNEATTSPEGAFSLALPPGEYRLSVDTSSAPHDAARLRFSPASRKVEVVDGPVDEVNFSQLDCTVRGRVVCGGPSCPPITINLKPKDTGKTLQTVAKGGEYELTSVPPGDYDVFIGAGLEWCWDKETQRVRVDSELTTVPTFTQSGRTMTILSSHKTEILYWSEGSSDKKGVTVDHGRSHVCVGTTGPVYIQPVGCYTYKQKVMKWESGTLKLEPILLSNVFHIKSSVKVDDLTVKIIPADEGGPMLEISPELSASHGSRDDGRGGGYVYEGIAHLRPGQRATLAPSASRLLFDPPYREIRGADRDCSLNYQQLFTAELGLVLQGKVKSGANQGLGDVTLKLLDNDENLISTEKTQADGSYRFPPIKASSNYRVVAEKEGYVLTESPATPGDFNAHKLAEICVTVTDSEQQPLQGVLLSLSGGESYRRNAQTNSSGVMSFLSLSPGEYFLRAMMKEYSFKPGGKIIQVQEGATIKVQLSGERVAWSGLGRVASLNGEGEGGVTVEAVGVGNCSLLQEEAVSAPNGAFRIRGLHPNCEYSVRVKVGPEINTHIQTSTPESIPVQVGKGGGDVEGLLLYALRRIQQTDVVVLVRFKTDEELRTAGKLRLAPDHSPDSPIVTLRLSDYAPRQAAYRLNNGVVVALGSVPADGGSYVVSAGSGGRAVTVRADGPLKLARITLTPPAATQPTLPDFSRPLYPPLLPLFIIGALMMYYRKKLLELMPELSLGGVQSDDSEDNSNRAKKAKSRKAM